MSTSTYCKPTRILLYLHNGYEIAELPRYLLQTDQVQNAHLENESHPNPTQIPSEHCLPLVNA